MKDWILIEREDGSWLRTRQHVDHHKNSGFFTFRIEVVWERGSAFDNEEDMADKLEQSLMAVMEPKFDAICYSVLTTDSEYVLTFYAKSVEMFSRQFERAVMFFPQLPVTLRWTEHTDL